MVSEQATKTFFVCVCDLRLIFFCGWFLFLFCGPLNFVLTVAVVGSTVVAVVGTAFSCDVSSLSTDQRTWNLGYEKSLAACSQIFVCSCVITRVDL